MPFVGFLLRRYKIFTFYVSVNNDRLFRLRQAPLHVVFVTNFANSQKPNDLTLASVK